MDLLVLILLNPLLEMGFTYKMFGNVPSNALASVMIIESLIA
jgi:hypothetical protein